MANGLAFYLHFPWCLRKCPYCDFNSYPFKSDAVKRYLTRVEEEIYFWSRKVSCKILTSIYLGGGTPTLLKPSGVARIMEFLDRHFIVDDQIEKTIEGNPVTFNSTELETYRALGFNRFSLGIQSFNPKSLAYLQRIHSREEGWDAIKMVKEVFANFNMDLMYGLPKQSLEMALEDLYQAISFHPVHLSWYQLTLKSKFLLRRPLPTEETIENIERAGRKLLMSRGLKRYEISSYAREGYYCKHNLCYWYYGDYLGIGAGAHSKLTNPNGVWRYASFKLPDSLGYRSEKLSPEKLTLEFFLNRLRLLTPMKIGEFTQRTGLPFSVVEAKLKQAELQGFIKMGAQNLVLTSKGKRFLDDLLLLFL